MVDREGILQEVRRAVIETYVAFIETDDEAGTFLLFCGHLDDDVVVVGKMVLWVVVMSRGFKSIVKFGN